MDALVVQGQGGTGQFQFGNRDPGTDSSLVFKLNEKHLKDCEDSRISKYTQPNFTVRRSFIARNTGDLPIYIHRFDVNGRSCEGYGFRVLHCQGFELKPNTSRKVDIAFTPDFTLSRVERVLNLHTSLGYAISYMLVATVPRHLLASCSKTIPRPSWESLLYYSIVSLLLFLFFCILTAAYLEGDRIVQATFFPMTTNDVSFDPAVEQGHFFDLRLFNRSTDVIDRFACSNLGEPETSEYNEDMELSADALCGSVFSDTKESEKEIQCNESEFEEHCSQVTATRSQNIKNFSNALDADEVRKDVVHDRLTPVNATWTRVLLNSFSIWNSKIAQENKFNAATQTVNEAKSDEVETERKKQKPFPLSRNILYDGKNKLTGRRFFGKNIYLQSSPKNLDSSSWEEETSSTTTESSNPESDISEKDHHLPDVCIPAHVVKHKNRSKTCAETAGVEKTKSPSAKVSDKKGGNEDQEFELSTKSKAHKKIKVDPTKVFSGDILCPSTLELPYKPQNVTSKDKSMNAEDSPSASVSYKPGNSIKIARKKSKDDSLYEISQATENFALHLDLEMANNNLRHLADDGATYSSVVSGENVDHWKMPPSEYRKTEWGKYIGVPSSLPSSKSDVSANSSKFSNRTWKLTAPAKHQLACHDKPLYSDVNVARGSGETDSIFPLGNFPSMELTDSDDGGISDIFPSMWTPQPVSVMQDLQAKRRQRLDEYYKQQALSNWPGFNTPSPEANFWDPSYIPAGENFIKEDSPSKLSKDVQSKEETHLWTSPTDSLWSPSSTVWPALHSSSKLASHSHFASTSLASEILNRSLVENLENTEGHANIESRKTSLDHLSSIWSPNVQADSNSKWKFSLFTDSSADGDKKFN